MRISSRSGQMRRTLALRTQGTVCTRSRTASSSVEKKLPLTTGLSACSSWIADT